MACSYIYLARAGVSGAPDPLKREHLLFVPSEDTPIDGTDLLARLAENVSG
ncbi:MAG: hypothetical protein IMW96_10200 [Thermoanaerobacteraceae bacterium]|nr:hypothetical protein [Thermoanaerobacteraceae bacterium]